METTGLARSGMTRGVKNETREITMQLRHLAAQVKPALSDASYPDNRQPEHHPAIRQPLVSDITCHQSAVRPDWCIVHPAGFPDVQLLQLLRALRKSED